MFKHKTEKELHSLRTQIGQLKREKIKLEEEKETLEMQVRVLKVEKDLYDDICDMLVKGMGVKANG